ncbi:hypothetical protein LTSEJOH_4870, partial [Salmonella enterica subsp. enterica serovar Johannesburg str. S5-703]
MRILASERQDNPGIILPVSNYSSLNRSPPCISIISSALPPPRAT